MRRAALPWWCLTGATLAVAAAAAACNVAAGEAGEPWWSFAAFASCAVSAAVLGLLVELRRPGHRIGRLLQAEGLVVALSGLASSAIPAGLGGAWAVLWDQGAWALLFAPVTAIALLFPDGRLPSPRWRPVARMGVAAFTAVLVAALLSERPFDPPYEDVEPPLGIVPAAAAGALMAAGLAGALATFLAAAVSLRVRARRAGEVERLQLRWLAWAACLIPLTLTACLVQVLLVGDDGPVLDVAVFLMLAGFPIAVALPILRHRLYDIDRLVSATVVYATLTAVLGGAYAGLTLLLATAAGGPSAWTTAAATLAVAAAFRPLRALVQDRVDRRFRRARHDGVRQVQAFLEELRAGRAEPEDVEAVLARALGDPTLQVRWWLPASEGYADALGRPAPEPPEPGRACLPVERAGEPLARVLHAPGHLDTAVVEAAGLAIEMARLRLELRRRLDEVSASRARLVAAADDERRRIERDLHDGAQQRLVSVGLALRHAQHRLNGGGGEVSVSLDRAVQDIGSAIAELRGLARGVRPPQLDDGLAPALHELAARAGLPVEVRATADRFPPGVEAAAYFVACEALTNVTRHAGATRALLTSDVDDDGRLVLRVSDDGVGGASAARGSGIVGLADRVHAHGGTLRVDSPAGDGTHLVAEFPCAS